MTCAPQGHLLPYGIIAWNNGHWSFRLLLRNSSSLMVPILTPQLLAPRPTSPISASMPGTSGYILEMPRHPSPTRRNG